MRGLIMHTPRTNRLLPGLVALAALTLSLSLDAKPAPAAVAAADPNETCLMCHADPAAKSEGGKSIAVDAKVFAGSVHGQMQLKCTDCHSDVSAEKLPHAPKLKPANCATCHEEPVKEYLSTAHAKARAGGNMVAATCTDCHGKHDIQKSTEPASRTNLANREATCGACHGNDADREEGKPSGRQHRCAVPRQHPRQEDERQDGRCRQGADLHGVPRLAQDPRQERRRRAG